MSISLLTIHCAVINPLLFAHIPGEPIRTGSFVGCGSNERGFRPQPVVRMTEKHKTALNVRLYISPDQAAVFVKIPTEPIGAGDFRGWRTNQTSLKNRKIRRRLGGRSCAPLYGPEKHEKKPGFRIGLLPRKPGPASRGCRIVLLRTRLCGSDGRFAD